MYITDNHYRFDRKEYHRGKYNNKTTLKSKLKIVGFPWYVMYLRCFCKSVRVMYIYKVSGTSLF